MSPNAPPKSPTNSNRTEAGSSSVNEYQSSSVTAPPSNVPVEPQMVSPGPIGVNAGMPALHPPLNTSTYPSPHTGSPSSTPPEGHSNGVSESRTRSMSYPPFAPSGCVSTTR